MLLRGLLYQASGRIALVRFASAAAAREITPAVRVLLDNNGISAEGITPTGPKGHLLKGDVLMAISSGKVKKAAPKQHAKADKSVSSSKSAAQRGTTPSTYIVAGAHAKVRVPHEYLTDEFEIEQILRLAETTASTPVRFEHFVLKAAAQALRAVPQANVVFAGDSLHALQSCEVALEHADSQTPLAYVQDAHARGLGTIAAETAQGTSQLHMCALAVSILGGIRPLPLGVTSILSITLPGTKRVVVADDGTPKVRLAAQAALSFDVRAIDSEAAALFLQECRKRIELPAQML